MYITPKTSSGEIVTLQVNPEAETWLRQSGLKVGDELGTAYRVLRENYWLSTLGDVSGGGRLDESSSSAVEVPLTVPWRRTSPYAPRFRYDADQSIHYTRLYVENSTDYWIEVPMIIKHHGAMKLIELGAVVGQEFTERALRMILEHRWAYSDTIDLP